MDLVFNGRLFRRDSRYKRICKTTEETQSHALSVFVLLVSATKAYYVDLKRAKDRKLEPLTDFRVWNDFCS